MGMVAIFRRLGDADLARLREEPGLVADYLEGEEPLEGFGPFADLDLDKAWHAIHFLLTGSGGDGEPPLNFIVAGGTEVGEDFGYGPARGFGSAEVRTLASALETLTVESLRQRFDPEALMAAEIYPQIWDRPADEDATCGYVMEYYGELRSFVLGAAAEREALLISLS